MLSGEQYYAEDSVPPHPADMRYDVEDITVCAVIQDGELLRVEGTHFTPYSVVYLNDSACATEYVNENTLLVNDTVASPDDEIRVAQVSASDALDILWMSEPFVFTPGGEPYADD